MLEKRTGEGGKGNGDRNVCMWEKDGAWKLVLTFLIDLRKTVEHGSKRAREVLSHSTLLSVY